VRQFSLQVAGLTEKVSYSVVPIRASFTMIRPDSKDHRGGVWKWRVKSNYPIVAGWTPTAGGLLFFGDVGGNLYAIDSVSGQKLGGRPLDGAIGGDVITYMADGAKKIAVAAGFTHPECPRLSRRQK